MSVSLRLIVVALIIVACPVVASAQGSSAPAGAPQAAAVSGGPETGGPDIGETTPLNLTAASARVLIPDGTSLVDNNGDGADQWFVAFVEAGKSYVVDSLISDADKSANSMSIGLFEADGTTPWSGYSATCDTAALDNAAPSLQGTSDTGSSADGARCNVMTYTNITNAGKLVFIKVTPDFSNNFRIRLRENTWYSRYTVNGYNYYVPVMNPGASTVAGWVMFFGGAGSATGAPSSETFFSLGPFAATQIVQNAGSITPITGTMRVVVSAGTDVVVESLAFNPTINQYLSFTPIRLNNVGNSW